jgi:hypothetical protein
MPAHRLTSVFALLLSVVSAPALADDLYCDLDAPPANAVADENHGFYFFIFPDALPPKFTGCKTWWIDTGQKFMVFRMEDGRLTEMSGLSSLPGQYPGEAQTETCLYPNGALAKGAPSGCLKFEDAQSFADHAIGTQYAPRVPAAKDLRTKTPL